MKNGAILNDNC